MVLWLVLAILVLYSVTVAVSLTVAPYIAGQPVSVDTYIFMLKLTILWSSLLWVCISMYLAIVCESDDYMDVSWMLFIVGAVMAYLGISSPFAPDRYWLGVRTLVFLLLSFVPVVILEALVRTDVVDRPSKRFAILFRNRRFFWRKNGKE